MSLDALDLAQKFIRCESVTPADGGVMQEVATAARAAQFEVEVFEAREGQHVVKNLIARRGTQGPILAFVGHVDVVPPGDLQAWRYPPFSATVEAGMLYGRGAVDMKSSLAAFLAAAARLPTDFSGSLQLLITGDEEEGSPQGMRAIIEKLLARMLVPDVGLIGEASNEGFFGQGMRIGRRGSLNVTVTAHGVQGHVAWPDRAKNAITPLVRFLAAATELPFGAAHTVFPPTHLEPTVLHTDNRVSNVVPARATARLNIRFNPLDTFAGLKAKLNALASSIDPQLQLDYQLSGEPYEAQAQRLTAALDIACSQVTGHTPQHNAGGGVSDGRFLHRLCPVVEFGLVGDTAHKVDERCALQDIVQLTDIYQKTLEQFFAASGP
jgi:succinyl-diaminopimelate desuccinylase